MRSSSALARRLARRRREAIEWLYRRGIARWSWWPLAPFGASHVRRPRENGDGTAQRRRVGYFIWHFPVLSQTFVRREIETLKRFGLSLMVFAEGSEDLELLGEDGARLVGSTRYVAPIDRGRLERYRRTFFRTRPLTTTNLFLFVMSRRYSLGKSLSLDRSVFRTAVHLAGHLRENGIDHVHSPWADRCGFIAMLAARLLKAPYSVQVRAHEIHDPDYHPALPDMLRNASFVITNTLYNRPFIAAHMGPGGPPVHTIYNGLDLAQFVPARKTRDADAPVRILCVARLIEQKGLVVLLEACALLRERGVRVLCDIVGGPEEPLYSDYLRRLRETHERLALGGIVSFRGAQPFSAVLESYRQADLFALPCVIAADGRRDITPNSLIEAMAMALPVVSTAITGIPEIVEDGVSGLLVPPGNARALADALQRLAKDVALAAELGRNARRQVESRFDADVNMRDFLSLFSSGTLAGPQRVSPPRLATVRPRSGRTATHRAPASPG